MLNGHHSTLSDPRNQASNATTAVMGKLTPGDNNALNNNNNNVTVNGQKTQTGEETLCVSVCVCLTLALRRWTAWE